MLPDTFHGMKKSSHLLKDLQICISDLLHDRDSYNYISSEWVTLLDCGGLPHVNTRPVHVNGIRTVQVPHDQL